MQSEVSFLEITTDTPTITPVLSLTEENLDTNSLTLTLLGTTLIDSTLTDTNFILNNAPNGVSIKSISYTDITHCTVNLAYDGTDFDTNETDFSITINAAELASASSLTSEKLVITIKDNTLLISIIGGGVLCAQSQSERSTSSKKDNRSNLSCMSTTVSSSRGEEVLF
jgi:hypothetical protein